MLSFTGNDKFEEQIVSLAEGFEEIAGKLQGTGESVEKKSPGKLLASILGKPEYADKISLYASGDQNRLASYLRPEKHNQAEKTEVFDLPPWLLAVGLSIALSRRSSERSRSVELSQYQARCFSNG